METQDKLYHTFNDVYELVCAHAVGLKKTVLLASPEDPDADSCASMLAFKAFLNWLGVLNGVAVIRGTTVDCSLYAPNKPRPNTLFERLKPLGDPYSEITTSLPVIMPDIIVSFDYGQFSRMRFDPIVENTLHIGFDHHPAKPGETSFPSNGLEVCDPSAPSTTALLYRFFKHVGFPINPAVADCLLVGLLADTGKLSNKLTSPEALETCAALMRAGGGYLGVLEAMRFEMSAKAFAAQLKARDNIKIDTDAGIGFLSFSRKNLQDWGGATYSDILPLIGLLQNIKEVRLAAAYYEREDGTWYGSLRSSPKKGVNVKKIAEKLGGGGHDYAAGFVSNESPDKIFQKLKEFLKIK